MVRAHPTVPTKSITSQERIEARPLPSYQLATMLLRARLLSPTTKYASLTILRLLRRPSQSTSSIVLVPSFLALTRCSAILLSARNHCLRVLEEGSGGFESLHLRKPKSMSPPHGGALLFSVATKV